jgi:hypothetical protein
VRGTRERDQPTPAVRLPILAAGLIVLASTTLAVYTLRRQAETVLSEESARAAAPLDRPVSASARPLSTPRPAERATGARSASAAAPSPRPAATLSTPSARSTSMARPADPTRPDASVETAGPASPVATRPSATSAPAAASAMAALVNVAPPRVKRGGTTLLDVHGVALRAEHHAVILRGGHSAADVLVSGQKLVGDTLIQVLVAATAGAKGTYDVIVLDARGNRSNAVSFEVVH